MLSWRKDNRRLKISILAFFKSTLVVQTSAHEGMVRKLKKKYISTEKSNGHWKEIQYNIMNSTYHIIIIIVLTRNELVFCRVCAIRSADRWQPLRCFWLC